MNLGKNITDLRRAKGITQDALAAELGVTAAAVSKWENGYTLPDVMMLCALADFFEVTTDHLLGRFQTIHHAVVFASNEALAEKICALSQQYGIIPKAVCYNEADASNIARSDKEITYLIGGMLGSKFPEIHFDLGDRKLNLYLSISDTEHDVLENLEDSLKNNC